VEANPPESVHEFRRMSHAVPLRTARRAVNSQRDVNNTTCARQSAITSEEFV
jgi:hypothetical protein